MELDQWFDSTLAVEAPSPFVEPVKDKTTIKDTYSEPLKVPENKSKENNESLSTSPFEFNFFNRWVKTLFVSSQPDKKRAYQKEVRSAFGWTDAKEQSDILDESNLSKSSTFSQQDLLPRLTIPDLKSTFVKYLLTIQPLLTPEEYETSKKAVEAFLQEGGIGEKLHQLLIEHNKQDIPSWLEPWWDDAYLCTRDAIPINVNYFFVFEDDPVPQKNYQIGRAASLLRGALVFKRLLDNEKVDPDSERGKPLDMSQYPRVFATTRVPGIERDSIISYTKWRPNSRSKWSKTCEFVDVSPTHVVVIYRNQFYRFDVIVDGSLIPLSEIENAFGNIIQQAHESGDDEYPVGVFTSSNRTEWAKNRKEMIDLDLTNLQTLEAIQSALIVVCLDNSAPKSSNEVSRVMLHGPITNRWFDKHQLVVCGNGKAGLNFEHSTGDGSTTLRVADEMYKYSVKHGSVAPIYEAVKTPSPHMNKSSSFTSALTSALSQSPPRVQHQGNSVKPVRLRWKLDEKLQIKIEKSYEEFKNAIAANESSTLLFCDFGGQFIKENNFSPDAFVQLAMQLAYFKMFGRSDATYESASTKQFLHGRTETVRSVTNESVNFVKSTVQSVMDRFSSDKISDQFSMMKKAADSHVKYMRDAKEAEGVDRHLFGLRMILSTLQQNDKELETPSVFTDKAYQKGSHWNLSTSHCGSSSLSLFGFGPVVADGFGIGYMIKNDSISFNVTSRYLNRINSSTVMTLMLKESLLHMQALVLATPEKYQKHSSSFVFTHPTNSAIFRYPWEAKVDFKRSVDHSDHI